MSQNQHQQHQQQSSKNKKPRHRNRQQNRRQQSPKEATNNGKNRSNDDDVQDVSGFTHHVNCKALGRNLPRLKITYTNEQHTIAEWIQQHVGLGDDDDLQCLGVDTETKPQFTRETALTYKGPDVLQLAKADGTCLVIHLTFMEPLQDLMTVYHSESVNDLLRMNGGNKKRKNRLQGYRQLAAVLESRRVAKAGVGLDLDAMELQENKLLNTNCRLDLRSIPEEEEEEDESNNKQGSDDSENGDGDKKDDNKNRRPQGLKGLTEYFVPGMTLPKQKRLQMSNWALKLSNEQVGYAAGDAFAAAIAVQTLVDSSTNEHSLQSLIDGVLDKEDDIAELRRKRDQKRQRKKEKEEARKKERAQAKKNKKGQGQQGKQQQQQQKKGYPPQQNGNGAKAKAGRRKRKNGNNNSKQSSPSSPTKKRRDN